MFKIIFHGDLNSGTYTPRRLRDIRGVIITCGYYCNHLNCKMRNKCKYQHFGKYHNFSVDIRRWIFYHTNQKVDIHFPWYFQKFYTNLAGTSKCPFNIERADSYTCYQCKYSNFEDCTNSKYIHASYNEVHDPNNKGRCKLFELDENYAKYDSRTGEIKF